jgi:signal transduction histidine kinase
MERGAGAGKEPPQTRAALPAPVRLYALGVAGSALLVLFGWWLAAPGRGILASWPVFLPILMALASAVARLAPLHLAPGRKLTVATAPNFAALLLFGPPLAMLVVAAGTLAAFGALAIRRKRRWWDALFNTGQIALAVGIGGVPLFRAARIPFAAPIGRPATLLALALAAAAMYLTNTAAVAGILALQRRRNPLRVWLAGRPADVLPEGTLFVVGALGAVAVEQSPWALVVLVGPTILVHQALRRAARLAEQAQAAAALEADRLKGELLSTVSHELRTPLGTIKGFASGLLQYGDRLDEAARLESVRAIDEAADQLTELVENLLDVQRLATGQLAVAREVVHLADVVTTVVADMAVRAPDHPLDLRIVPDLPPVWGDARRLRQVVQNLLDNARKYSPVGSRITVRLAGGTGHVELRVEDAGTGIPPDQLALVFDRFHRVDSSLTRQVAGTGLGLAIVRELVVAQGGTVRAESAGLGQGSTFIVTVPAVTDAAPAGQTRWQQAGEDVR